MLKEQLKQNRLIRKMYGVALDKFCCLLTDISPHS